MKLEASKSHPLEFEIDGKTYSVKPCGIAAGLRLAELWTTPPEQLAKVKMSNVDLFRLALGPVWGELEADEVPYTEAFRLAMACLAREQVLLTDDSPERWDNADRSAVAVWRSGVDPKAVAAALEMTPPSTRRAAATTTRRPASGSGTSAKAGPKKPAPRSRGRRSPASGR